MNESEVPARGVRIAMGIAFAAAGLIPILAALDVGPFRSSSINGPPWLGLVAGGIFLVAAIVLCAYDATIRMPWLGSLLAFVLLGGLGAIGNWIAFGVGTRECSGSGGIGFFFDSRTAAEIECRAAFGIGALLIDGMLVWVLGVGMRQMGMPGRLPVWVEKLGQGLLLLAVAPLVIVLLVIAVGKALVEACATYFRTGTWPRNPDFPRKPPAAS